MTKKSKQEPNVQQDKKYSDFSMDDPELPAWIDDEALASGGYPYDEKMKTKDYEQELYLLHIELAKLQRHVIDQGQRVVLLFEGRDAAGKGGTIKRFTAHLNPRSAPVVALPKPTEAERGQWYFQRYVQHLPTKGNLALFDRSWYNRAGVEKVFGFCTDDEHNAFLRETPEFEKMLQRDGIKLFKFWLTIGREMQLKRLHARRHDPLKHWKLSPIDFKAIHLWEDYTKAKEVMFQFTHELDSPWWVVRANDKKRARLEAIRKVLSEIDYADKDVKAIGKLDDKILGNGPDFFYSA
jgi:polyphosphate kinase 2